MNATIVYASTSGSTKLVAAHLGRLLLDCGPYTINISDYEPGRRNYFTSGMLFLISPTYGKGDLHWAWHEYGAAFLNDCSEPSAIGLLALGDSKRHNETFCGALNGLSSLIRARGFDLHNRYMLALDYKNQRSLALESVSAWARTISHAITVNPDRVSEQLIA